jgi:hypothetical protein
MVTRLESTSGGGDRPHPRLHNSHHQPAHWRDLERATIERLEREDFWLATPLPGRDNMTSL